jgi:hypothetical protein
MFLSILTVTLAGCYDGLALFYIMKCCEIDVIFPCTRSLLIWILSQFASKSDRGSQNFSSPSIYCSLWEELGPLELIQGAWMANWQWCPDCSLMFPLVKKLWVYYYVGNSAVRLYHVAEVPMFRKILELSTFYHWWWIIDYQFEDGTYICYASISEKQVWLLYMLIIIIFPGLCDTNSVLLTWSVYHALTECPMAKILYEEIRLTASTLCRTLVWHHGLLQ